jgi:hypothetical protein
LFGDLAQGLAIYKGVAKFLCGPMSDRNAAAAHFTRDGDDCHFSSLYFESILKATEV